TNGKGGPRRAAATVGYGPRSIRVSPWTVQTASSSSSATSRAPRRQGRKRPVRSCPIPSNQMLPPGLNGTMTLRHQLVRIFQQEDINFLLTNRLPRQLVTQFVGWLSRIEKPPIPGLAISLWRFFSDLDLSEAKNTHFRSMHACFTRELKAGARPIVSDPSILISPCDAIIGACGSIAGNELLQIKGSSYALEDLLGRSTETYRNGRYVTLRLTSSMYHRFHAPYDCSVGLVTYISGDTWNVNPIALKRVERLFCKNV